MNLVKLENKIFKINYLNLKKLTKFKFFLILLAFIFLFRSLLLFVSLGDYPFWQQWEVMKNLIYFEENGFDILIKYTNENFQLYTKFLSIILYLIFEKKWYMVLATSIGQIVISFNLSFLITQLFYSKKVNYFTMFLIILFALSIGSFNNFFNFSEIQTHFFIFFSLLIFYFYSKEKLIYNLIVILILCFSFLNMEYASLLIPLSLSIFSVFIFFNNKKLDDIWKFVLYLLIFTISYYYINYLDLPVVNNSNHLHNFDVINIFKIILKSLFHKNNLLFFFYFFLFFFMILKKKKLKKILNENHFILLLIIWFLLTVLVISFSRGKIFDRYLDYYQIIGIITIYFFNEIHNQELYKKITIYFVLLVVVLFNFLRTFEKVYEYKNYLAENDKKISSMVNLVKLNKPIHKIYDKSIFWDFETFNIIIKKSIEYKIIN